MHGLSRPRHHGIFPVVPTTLYAGGTPDLASQRRCLDVMIDSGVASPCLLASFSGQFLLAAKALARTGGDIARRLDPPVPRRAG
ncbi:Uncharacterised protein [Delftia tsuruhatensis]|uniref:hypothetical protein n=1 Tax=Delftia tsuruhatensis TaxID=180282 RepID=UPI001E7D3178|nr:Uncharacterised protein [Delftia tsuruhatensis]CAC9679899.1 Uncharacterised protein [Delftia tsuruhatensis]